MRARGFAVRDAFPDALCGLISEEEARDYSDPIKPPMQDITPPAKVIEADKVETEDKAYPSPAPVMPEKVDKMKEYEDHKETIQAQEKIEEQEKIKQNEMYNKEVYPTCVAVNPKHRGDIPDPIFEDFKMWIGNAPDKLAHYLEILV